MFGKAVNCDEKCSNYVYCFNEGNDSRFLPGAVCPDRREKDEDNECK